MDPLEATQRALEPGQVSAQISRRIVQLHASLYGRGPTRAKTYVHDDYVLAVLEDIFTPAEQTLIRVGKAEHVEGTRRAFADAVRDQFRGIVEDSTGRPVKAFISQVHIATAVAVAIFLFEPRQSEPL